MLFKTIVTLLSLVGCALAVEYIDLNDDHLNNLLPLEISKPLKNIQDSLREGFKFEHVSDALNFIDSCDRLKSKLSSVNDADYEGLGGKMKALMQEPQLVTLCAVDKNEFKDFMLLDADDIGVSLTTKRMQAMLALGENLDKRPEVKTMLKFSFEKSKRAMVDTLLQKAAQDTDSMFGEQTSWYNLGPAYKSTCGITDLKKICKLVRRTNSEDVSALGPDVADFIAILSAKDQAKLEQHVQLSGVSLEDLKSTCEAVDGRFHVMKVVDAYSQAKFLDQSDIEAQKRIDPHFYLYHEMFNLCKVATSN